MLIIDIIDSDGTAPTSVACEEAWLNRLGPTAWCLLRWGYTHTSDLEPGTQVYVNIEDLRRHLGVKTDVLLRAIARLQRFGIVRFDIGAMTLETDFMLPPRTPMAVPIHIHRHEEVA